eukprot:TCALIF_13248-PA protein Name:"Protein of unknown function" AED:0.30 eAED:0.30 QI:229/0.5/0.4/0.6/1/0.8/5/0/540
MCQSRTQCRIFLMVLGCIGLSALAAVPMFILTHPGDECLLFVSVRGEALIYGNPAGCHFIAYGHCCVIFGAMVLTFLLFFPHRRKGFVKRDAKDTVSNRSIGGTLQSGMVAQSSTSVTSRQIVARIYSTKVIVVATCLAMFSVVLATVILSGYLVSCDELAYETRREIYGRGSLGKWHGQYRHYKHGRVHEYSNEHEHVIPVAAALEMSLGGTWGGAVLWCILLGMLIYQRCAQKRRQNRELAESIEDARIYATQDGVMMHPMDQMSVTSSHQSSILTQKPQMSMDPSIMGSSSHMNPTPVPMVHQQMSSPNGTVHSQQSNNVQYVQLANGVLVPMTSLPPQQPQHLTQNAYAQLQLPPSHNSSPSLAQQQQQFAQYPSQTNLGSTQYPSQPQLSNGIQYLSQPQLSNGIQYPPNPQLNDNHPHHTSQSYLYPNQSQPVPFDDPQSQTQGIHNYQADHQDLQRPIINQMDRSPRASPMPGTMNGGGLGGMLPPATSIQNLTKSPGPLRASGSAARSRRAAAHPIEEDDEIDVIPNNQSAQ